MRIEYPSEPVSLTVLYGILKHDVKLKQEINPLLWIPMDTDFADRHRFAGHGNVHHIISSVQYYLGEQHE